MTDNTVISQPPGDNKNRTISNILEDGGSAIYRFITPVTKGVSYVAMTLVALMVLVVVFDVIARNFDISFPGIYELQTFLMIMVTYFSLAYVTLVKKHIVIDLITSNLPKNIVSILDVINNILAVTIMALMAWQTTIYGMSIYKVGTYTPIWRLPLWSMVAIITLGIIITLIVLLGDLLVSLAKALDSLKRRWALIIAVIAPVFVFALPYLINSINLSDIQIGVFAVIIMLIFLFMGLPVIYAIAIGGFIGCAAISTWASAFNILGSLPYGKVADFFLTVIPFFVLMGSLATVAGISTDLFETFKAWLGRLPGSLAMATIAGGAAFGAVCGDSVATAAAMGKAALPEMKKMKYADTIAGGSVAVAGTLGIMIPPSTVFIVYALLAEQSVGALFLAGILPGLLTAGLLMLTVAIMVIIKPELAPRGEGISIVEKIKATRKTWGMILLFALVMGGIYTGKFTPVEAGAIGAFGAFIFSFFRKSLNRKNLVASLLDAAEICGMLLFIFVGVGLLNATLALSKIPIILVGVIEGMDVSRYVILGIIVIAYVFLGCILNILPVIMLTVPILMPTVLFLEFDPIWFGVIIVLMAMIGQVTPPVGLVGYVVKGMAPYMSVSDIFKGLTPLWLAMIVSVILITLFPQIALFIPNVM